MSYLTTCARRCMSVLLTLAVSFTCLVPAFADTAFQEDTSDASQRYQECEVDPASDYMAIMQECCVSGEIEAGQEAERLRNLKIDRFGLPYVKIAFMDLYLLSKIITMEAGSDWLPMYWKMSVGEVLLNRVESPEYPDTISDCVYAPGQYSGVNEFTFQNAHPYESCVIAATRLLSGERLLRDSSVVFQSNSPQGEIFVAFHDDVLGTTYFCKSSHTELYE